jgi:hypothetical protein
LWFVVVLRVAGIGFGGTAFFSKTVFESTLDFFKAWMTDMSEKFEMQVFVKLVDE